MQNFISMIYTQVVWYIKYKKYWGLKMGTNDNNKYDGPERRAHRDRRTGEDRRANTRFSDVLGRRSGVERRLPVR